MADAASEAAVELHEVLGELLLVHEGRDVGDVDLVCALLVGRSSRRVVSSSVGRGLPLLVVVVAHAAARLRAKRKC